MIPKHRFLLEAIPSAPALGWAGTAGATSPYLRQCQADRFVCGITGQCYRFMGICTI
jgi:hypothetical protein